MRRLDVSVMKKGLEIKEFAARQTELKRYEIIDAIQRSILVIGQLYCISISEQLSLMQLSTANSPLAVEIILDNIEVHLS